MRAFGGEQLDGGGPDAARGAGDHGDLVGEGLRPSRFAVGLEFCRDEDALAGHERRAFRQHEAKHAFEPFLCSRLDLNQARGGAALAKLLRQAPNETVESLLRGCLLGRGARGRWRTEHHHPAARSHATHQGMKELVKLLQAGHIGDRGAVEHQARQLRLGLDRVGVSAVRVGAVLLTRRLERRHDLRFARHQGVRPRTRQGRCEHRRQSAGRRNAHNHVVTLQRFVFPRTRSTAKHLGQRQRQPQHFNRLLRTRILA